jgi:hypothetical protein
MPGTTSRFVRGVLVALLTATLACFFLSVVRISFDQAAIDQIRQVAPNVGQPPQTCIDDGLVSYTGISLLTNSPPGINRACLSNVRDAGDAQLGVQPVVVVAALLLLAAIVSASLGRRWHRLLVAGLATVALVLMVVNNLRFFDAFQAHFGGAGPVAGPSLLQSQASAGFWAVTGLLAAACVTALGYEGVRLSRRALAPIGEEQGAART